MQNSATGKFLPRLTFKKLLIMKMLCLFILAASLQVHARVTAQTVTYAARNAKIEDVFKEIKRQTGYGFIYNSRLIESAKPVTIEVDNKALKEVLDVCFKDQPFTYEINNKTVVVKEKAEASKSTGALTMPLPAPGVDVHGRVTDSVGNPLVGASVKVKGVSGKGAVTDENGEFWVKQVDNNAVLVIEFVGYGTREYSVAGRTEIPATLRMTNKELAEVAIQSYSSGYQTIPKERVAGSFTFLNKDLINRRVSPDILSRIDGIAAGVLFTNNASTANATTDLTIRGRSTLFSNASPLIILDNFPYDGDINSINPNDIENITLLKDASAASIWGVQSGNGVIVLTTKKGRRNRPLQVEFNTNFTVGEKPDIYYRRNFMGSSDFIEVEKSLFSQGYYDAKITDPGHAVYSPVVQILADQRAGRITAADANTRIEALKKNDVRAEFSKYYYQPRLLQQYAVNISGGSDKAEYYMSAGYDQDKSNLVLNKSHRVTLKTSETFYLLKNLSVSTDLLYSQTSRVNNNTIGDVNSGAYPNIYPYAKFRDDGGKNLSISKNYSDVWINDPISQGARMSYRYVPLDELGRVDNEGDARDTKLNLGIKYSFLKMFSFGAKYQYEYANSKSSSYFLDSSYYSRFLYNWFYNPSGTINAPVPKGGIYQYANNFIYSHRGRVNLDFKNTFAGKHSIVALIGAEISQIKSNYESPNTFYGYKDATKSYTLVDFLTYYPTFPSGSSTIPTSQGFNQGLNRFISYFGNASYTFNKRYDFTISGRIDKSNLFGVSTNQKSVPLYSLGAAWNLSDEKFYHFSLLPYLKLRATYGYNGNINNGVTAVPTIAYVNVGYLFPLSFAQLRSIANPSLRWERIRVANFGVDFASKGNIVSGSLEYYQKRGLDIFGNTPLPPSSGTTTFLGNTANISGNGFEMSLSFAAINTKIFQWKSDFILTSEISKVSKYFQKTTAIELLAANGYNISPLEGKPVYGIWSLRSGPLTSNTGDPQGYIGGKLSTDYTSIIGKATPDSLVFNGSARPTIYGSWRNSISFKRLSLSFNIVYKLNYYFRRTSINYSSLYSAWIQNSDFASRWQKPGDEQYTNVPSMPLLTSLNGNREDFYTWSDKLVDKGDHIRLQDIALSYEFNTMKFGRQIIKSLQIYSYINNLGIIWRANKDRLDPDVASNGIPNPRTYAIGVKATF